MTDQLVTQIVLSLVSAFVAASLTAWFSLRRFHSEKWFERKIQAYVALIEALHNLKRDLEETAFSIKDDKLSAGTDVSLPTLFDDEYGRKYRASFAELLKLIDIGDVFLSSDAREDLNDLRAKFEATGHVGYFHYITEMNDAVEMSLTRLKIQATLDLTPTAYRFK